MKYGTSAKAPAGVAKADASGEQKEPMRGGVGMGKKDMTGADKTYDTGRTAGVCYTHERTEYKQK